jgi:microcystin-dependent protein
MPLELIVPTALPQDDPNQYIPLLLSAIEGFLQVRDVWDEADYVAGFQYMEMLKEYVVKCFGKCGDMTPVGAIMMCATSSPGTGWLLCNGQSVLRSAYPALFALIGLSFGVDDSAHFHVPDFRSKSPYGYNPGAVEINDQFGTISETLALSQIPSHAHLEQVGAAPSYLGVGGTGRTGFGAVVTSSLTRVTTDSIGGGGSHNNIHPIIGIPFMIFAGV